MVKEERDARVKKWTDRNGGKAILLVLSFIVAITGWEFILKDFVREYDCLGFRPCVLEEDYAVEETLVEEQVEEEEVQEQEVIVPIAPTVQE